MIEVTIKNNRLVLNAEKTFKNGVKVAKKVEYEGYTIEVLDYGHGDFAFDIYKGSKKVYDRGPGLNNVRDALEVAKGWIDKKKK